MPITSRVLFSGFVVDGPAPKYYMRFPNRNIRSDMPYGHADMARWICVGDVRVRGKNREGSFLGSSENSLIVLAMKLKYEKHLSSGV